MSETGLPVDPAAFVAQYQGTAELAATDIGWFPSVVLAQWCDETDYGTSIAFVDGHNFAGVSPGGAIAKYSSPLAGLMGYITCARQSIYGPVSAAGSWQAQAVALGRSAWAAGHYVGDPPFAYEGGALVAIISNLGLNQGDPMELPVFSTSTGDAQRAEVRLLVRQIKGRELDSSEEQNALVAYGVANGRDLLMAYIDAGDPG